MDFSSLLLKWYLQNKRDLPWRNTTNPYLIWLSEIMLQQTRVAQGLPYFLSFVSEFPTVFDLANANEEKVLKLWQGLGYYSRARNMHKTAQDIAFERQGVFPNAYNELLQLKGIGEYTAAAIASFAYNEVVPVVDGNVFRVLSRFFGIETDIASSAAKKEFVALARTIMPSNNPALFNQAIMEFGALQCVPKSPNCATCIFNTSCVALQKNKVKELPVKSRKTKVKNRYFNYLIFQDKNHSTIVQKRTQKGIWHNLYEFPLIETNSIASVEVVLSEIYSKFGKNNIENVTVFNEQPIVHKLSHQHLHICFYKIDFFETLPNAITIDTLRSLPFPIVLHDFIEKNML